MNKVLFFGTDLHNSPTELASKTVRKLSKNLPDSKVLSIQNVKPIDDSEVSVVPRVTSIRFFRLIIQSILLPFYFIYFRLKGYDKILMFWTVNNFYHDFILNYLKLLKFKIYFTIISGYDKNYSSLKHCDIIICQSEKMKEFMEVKFEASKIKLIYPGVDLDLFKPSKNKNVDFVILSVPYNPKDFNLRGIDKILAFLKQNKKFSAVIVSRSEKSSEEILKLKLKNVKVISRPLSEKELSKVASQGKIMPLLYSDRPDMPLSAVEAMASGCAIICEDLMGLSDFVEENNCGVVTSEINLEIVNKLINNKTFGNNSRKAALKNFDEKKMIKSYLSLLK
ncbi:MAG: glycosyltransferase [Nanoarchaeota archaeon]|nr:glycosyltransferase [Nanoarchaeota archaeon]